MTDASSKIGADTTRRIPPNAGKGRPKGALNKTTAAAKELLKEAFDGVGGVEALVEWGKKNQTEFYKLWGRLIPVDMKHSGTVGTFDASLYTAEQLDALERALEPIAAASGDAEDDPPGEGEEGG